MPIKNKRRTREPTPQEKREQIYADTKEAFAKLKAGDELTEREARLLKKMHTTFLELYDVFKPSIISTLRKQGQEIDALLEEAESDEDEED